MKGWTITIVAGVLAFSGPMLSQEKEALDPEKHFLFSARAFGDDRFEGLQYYDPEKNAVELTFDPYARTPIYGASRGMSEIRFFKMGVDERGREREVTMAVADIDNIESRALIIFLATPDRKRNLPYSLLVADESPDAFVAGQLRFLNLAGPSLMARVGERSFPLGFGFGGDQRFDVGDLRKMPLEFAVRVEDRWKIVYSTGFQALPDVGLLAIVKPPRTVDSLRIRVELTAFRAYQRFDASGPEESETAK